MEREEDEKSTSWKGEEVGERKERGEKIKMEENESKLGEKRRRKRGERMREERN